jgi:hypothetical protein
MLTGLPPWVRSAKIARLSRELRAAGSFRPAAFATDWSFRRLRTGTTAASIKIAFPVNNRKNTGDFSTERRVGGLSREGEGTGFVRAAACLWVRSAQSAISAQSDVGGFSGSFGHNTAGRRGGFSCLIRALGFVTSSWVCLAHIECALAPLRSCFVLKGHGGFVKLESQSVRRWLPTPAYPDGAPATSGRVAPKSNPGYAG